MLHRFPCAQKQGSGAQSKLEPYQASVMRKKSKTILYVNQNKFFT
jgi:hypothetical protein